MSTDSTPISSEKRCPRCGKTKSHDQFYKRTNSTDGLQRVCKECDKEYRTENEAHRRELRQLRYASKRDEIRAYNKAYHAQNKERLNQRAKEYREKNIDKLREYDRERWRTEERKAYDRERARRRRARSDYVEKQKKWRVDNREYMRIYMHEYDKARNGSEKRKEQSRQYSLSRRARERNLPVVFTSTDWQYALTHFNNRCAVCDRPRGLWHTLAADHWIPLTSPDCPGTVAWNMVPLCQGVDGCNNAKSNKQPEQWLIEQFGKRKAAAILRRIEAYLDSRRPPDDATA